MEWVETLSILVGSIGLPTVLVIGGGWWFIQRGWPDALELVRLYADALCNMAHALERVADKLPDP